MCVQGGAFEVLRAIIFESTHYSKKCLRQTLFDSKGDIRKCYWFDLG